MTSVATLLGEIFALTRGDLENALFPVPSLFQRVRAMGMVRVVRLSSFWKERDSQDPGLLQQASGDLIAGLYSQFCPWLFLLRGTSTQIECWFGVHQEIMDAASLGSLMMSVFADARVSTSVSFDARCFEQLRYSQILTGTPSSKSSEQIEKICRGLSGGHWVYGVLCDPVASAETARNINDLAERIRDVRTNYLLKTSAIDEQNRTAQRYVELLEAKLKRFEEGRVLGMWKVQSALLTESPAWFARGQHLLQAAFSGEDSVPDPVRVRPCAAESRQSPAIEPLTSTEVAILTRPPSEDYPGYEVTEYARFGVEPNHAAGEGSIAVGEILDRGIITGNWLRVRREDLTKHALIVGVTGSGKTNTCFGLLDQIWDNSKGVPFLVIESAKSEYRQLLRDQRFRGLQVFTVGDDTVSPLRLNPFEVPQGILVQTHIDYVKSLFSAAFVLYPPMPYVLEQAIQEIYEDRGWDISRNTNSRGADSERVFPTLSDLAAKVGVVVDRMGYDQRITMDVKAGLLARIDQLRLGGGKGLMLNTRRSVSPLTLFESPCLLELKQIVSDDEKAFLIGLLLIRLYEFHEARRNRSEGLAHVTLIEEAHRLLRNVSTEQGGEVAANPKGRAIEVFANILSEIRAYGEGIIIAEQIPVKLTPDALKNTGLKVIHRLVSQDDRELVGSAINLDEAQMRYVATLGTGEAVAWSESTRKAILVRVPISPVKAPAQEVSPEEIRVAMEPFRKAYPELNLPFPECRYCPTKSPASGCLAKRTDASDPALLDAFRRLFNAMRLNPSLIPAAYAEFHHLTQRSARRSQAGEPYCFFVGLAEAELERRGEFRGCAYQDVEEAISIASAIVHDVMKRFDESAAPSIQEALNGKVRAFQELFKGLDVIQTFPYPGCRYCASPCAYRFDMAQAGAVYGKEFRSAFVNPGAKTEEVIQTCRHAAAKCFPARDEMSIEGAALCFAIQEFGRSDLGLSMHYQEKTAAMFKNLLATAR